MYKVQMSFSMPCDPSHDQTMLYGLPGRTHCALSLHIPQLCLNDRDDKFWDALVRTVRTVRTAVRTDRPNFLINHCSLNSSNVLPCLIRTLLGHCPNLVSASHHF
ncbi:hypothetical protein YC2023_089240 [Brassica napus]